MTIRAERVILDTNIWIFGLRRTSAYEDCALLLNRLGDLTVLVPRQILRELQLNLSDDELREFFRLVSLHPARIGIDWGHAPTELVKKYEAGGWRRGDAVIAAHLEHLAVPSLVSENREFLKDAPGLPFRLLTAAEALASLAEPSSG